MKKTLSQWLGFIGDGIMKKLKWYGMVFAIFMLFIYIMGIYDIFMILSFNNTYYFSKGYGEIVIKYFTNYPIYLLVLWILNLVCGLLSPILYLLSNRYSYKIAFISFFSDLILIVLGVLFKNRFRVFSVDVICFDIFILIITLLFSIFLYKIFIRRM